MTAVASCVGVLPRAGLAQEQSSQSQTFHFEINPGAMSTVLTAFSEVTGVQLVYTSSLVKELKSSGLSGKYSAQDALATLLAGSGITARFTGAKTVALVRQASSDTRVLGPVRVEGAEATRVSGINGSRDVTATEDTGSFTTGAMTIGSKAPRSMKDTAQSVSVITSEQLDQQNVSDFNQALKLAPGVSFAQGDTNLETSFYSRGFEITSIQIDGGAPVNTSFVNFFPQIDLSQYDHVELLRGAAGLFNGYGDPSGTVNLVRKKPLDHEQVMLDTEWGSWNHYRSVLDASAPLAFDGKLGGRVVVTWQSNEYFYDIAEDQKTLLYGILSYDLTPSTLLTAGVSDTTQDGVPWYSGLPRYQTGEDLKLPRATALIAPWSRWDVDTTEIFGSIEQRMGENWTAKLNLTHLQQDTTRKVGFSSGTVNPVDHRGPTLVGQYKDFASDQLSAEATLSGTFTLFGQRQELTLGVNRSNQDGSGYIEYLPLISSSAAAPYQPYPGGPRYCSGSDCPPGSIGVDAPPIDVFDFNPYDPIYSQPADPLPISRDLERGQVQTLAYLNVRLTAFDRLHLETGLRWSRFEYKYAIERLCTSIPENGTPAPDNCVGRQIGDSYAPLSNVYSGEAFSWPPSVALSYDVSNDLISYLGYTDIYVDQSHALDGDLEPIGPITGENIELGLKWSPREGRVNASVAVYRIKKRGFASSEPGVDRKKRNPDGSIYRDETGAQYIVTNNGTELRYGQVDSSRFCCYIQGNDRIHVSKGLDAELTGEVLPGWQVAASYTFSQNKYEGKGYESNRGQPFTTIQPERLYKLWTTYDFRASGATGWLANFTASVGFQGQSKGYRSGTACPPGQVGDPDETGEAPCLVRLVPYEFTVEPYTVFSGRLNYRFNTQWSAALNVENLFDKTYYQSVGQIYYGNWYGPPRSFTLSLRGAF
ncbi:TonB-dependent siderophore receptor [Steroidobacter flavus]|uniref:TonB-dependent siderophore receptor n=1 Tax=Steroidobacter flavus TaxID=1842136 RepID=A0ABV8SU64_9GAMM